MTASRLTVRSGPLTAAQAAAVTGLSGAAARADGVAPLSEHGALRVRYAADGTGPADTAGGAGTDLLAITDGEIAGYAYLDPAQEETGGDLAGELVVHPAMRRQGAGTALVRALGQAAAAGGGPRAIRVWAHGDLPAAAGLARAAGFERFRALWQMRAALAEPPPAVSLPPGVTLRTFRPGADEDEWLRLNARAFAKHPEQGAWTRRDVELREAEPWFDPGGFFIAERSGETGGAPRMVAFHWTKIHPAGQDGGGRIGEVYVVGVDPDAHGGGIGRAITVAGLGYLRGRGLRQVMLYVDEDNAPAIRIYSSLGFTRWRADAMYRGLVMAG